MRRIRRDALIIQLTGQLADARAREAALLERLAWYQAAMKDAPGQLRLVPDVKPRAAQRRA